MREGERTLSMAMFRTSLPTVPELGIITRFFSVLSPAIWLKLE